MMGADTSQDLTIHSAVATQPVEIGFTPEEDRVYEVTFTALVDPTQPDGRLLAILGSA